MYHEVLIVIDFFPIGCTDIGVISGAKPVLGPNCMILFGPKMGIAPMVCLFWREFETLQDYN